MNIGDLRHRVTLQQPKKTPTDRGGRQQEWVDVAPLWASVVGLKAFERVETQQVQSGATQKVTVRYRQGITASMRFAWNGRYLYLRGPAVDPDGRRTWLEALCEERQE